MKEAAPIQMFAKEIVENKNKREKEREQRNNGTALFGKWFCVTGGNCDIGPRCAETFPNEFNLNKCTTVQLAAVRHSTGASFFNRLLP